MPAAAEKPVADFAAALTKAVVTNNTLELASGTFFLGEPSFESKLYIRLCYKEIAKLILSRTSRNIVVTGTPGIGKSVSGFYLLYRLRREGETVVFERKGNWYRFSDAGAEKGNLSSFESAGYFDDPDCWYLSDPEDRPKEMFGGRTVVLVSPKYDKVKEFMKQGDAKRLFMPVWDLKELLECQLAVFPDVPDSDVKDRFDVVGGVARAIFNKERFESLKGKILEAARKVDVGVLRDAVDREAKALSTDNIGDTLFHVFPGEEGNYKDCSVSLASSFARDAVVKNVVEKEASALKSFLGAAMADPKLGNALGGSVVGSIFERVAHNAICLGSKSGGNPETCFKMEVLTHGDSSKDIVGRDTLLLNFTRSESFGEGNAFPDKLDIGTYYIPTSQTFEAIDSFGVGSGSSTLYFFQMKSAAFTAKNRGKVEEYWNIAVSHQVSIKRCVFVYAVPEGERWRKATARTEGRDWLTGATDRFKAVCDVCVIEIPCKN